MAVACHPTSRAAEPAREYWRRAHAPAATPGGRPIPSGPAVSTLQEGVWLIAANRGGMLLCGPTAAYHRRRDVVDVPVSGLPEMPLPWIRIQLVQAALTLVLIVIKFLATAGHYGWGAWFGLLLAGAFAYGVWAAAGQPRLEDFREWRR